MPRGKMENYCRVRQETFSPVECRGVPVYCASVKVRGEFTEVKKEFCQILWEHKTYVAQILSSGYGPKGYIIWLCPFAQTI